VLMVLRTVDDAALEEVLAVEAVAELPQLFFLSLAAIISTSVPMPLPRTRGPVPSAPP